VFTRSGDIWIELAKVSASDGKPENHFGGAVAVDGDRTIIGAPTDTQLITREAGAAYVFLLIPDADPEGQGFWHRQCLGVPAADGGIDPGRYGRGPHSPTEPLFVEELMPCADDGLEDLGLYATLTCDGMDADPANDPCQKAEKQLTALLLNACSGRVSDGCEVDVSAEGCSSTTVGDLFDEIATLIVMDECDLARSCAAAVNEGIGLVDGGGTGVSADTAESDAEVAPSEELRERRIKNERQPSAGSRSNDTRRQ
jgi:hypothetical protein